jgi:hypothetical protein
MAYFDQYADLLGFDPGLHRFGAVSDSPPPLVEVRRTHYFGLGS